MSKRILRLLAALLALTFVAAACGDDDGEAADELPPTVLEVAVANGQFTTLIEAVEAADLTETLEGEGPFTLFAPTNAAFEDALEALGMTKDELFADTETLTDILTYHVLDQEADSQLVATLDGEEVETLNGQSVLITVDGGTVFVVQAEVVSADLFAENGVVHAINAVLLPPDIAEALGIDVMAPTDETTTTTAAEDETTTTTTDEDETTTTAEPEETTTTTAAEDETTTTADEAGDSIVDVATAAGFTTLVAAVEAADLGDTLSAPDANLTVFAPTDAAFTSALTELGMTAEELLADTALLTDILTYHVVAGVLTSEDVGAADGTDVTTVQGATVAVAVDGTDVTLTDQVDRTAMVTQVDVEASNGIIHVIDNVILPAAP